MSKRIAVIIRDRPEEAVRMSLGLILMDDSVDTYFLDRKLEITGDAALNLDTLREMDVKLYTNRPDNNGMEYLSTEEIARRLAQYDHVVPY